jgi:hypothetical protein
VADEAAVIRGHCLAHGRRKVSDLVEVFPHECQVVLEVLSAVFDHAEQARQAQRSPDRNYPEPLSSNCLLHKGIEPFSFFRSRHV